MHRIYVAFGLCVLLFVCPLPDGQSNEEDARNRPDGRVGGDQARGKAASGADKGSGAGTRRTAHVRLRRYNEPAAARVSIAGSDGKPCGPADAALRKTKRDESYFYADDSFDVELPAGRVRMNVSGGLETIPQTVTVDAEVATELTVQMQHWVDMAARGWYSGDSHVHLHTGGPIGVTVADALVAARAEGVNYVNLCVSNNVGDDIRDAEMIIGRPHAASTDRHLLVFGEEMRSSIYGHMQFFGISRLVEPQYTGFDGTPHRLDFPANHAMAADAVGQGAVVTYGHPMFAGQPYPFEEDPAKPNAAARELPVDAVLGVVHAVDLMSYNSDEGLSAGLWYRLLNCGLRLSACVGTDALLDQSTEPLGGERAYVKLQDDFSAANWVQGLKAGRSFVTNGHMVTFAASGYEPGREVELKSPVTVPIKIDLRSPVALECVEIIVNGRVAKSFPMATAGPGPFAQVLDQDLAVDRSCWIAIRARGPESSWLFDGPAWAHTSPV